jgi:hypothetical protein
MEKAKHAISSAVVKQAMQRLVKELTQSDLESMTGSAVCL